MTDEVDPMIEIRASFFVECEELLESLQDGLQLMDDGQSDDETINVVFRAIHSIKGGAGAFGLEELVRFAHQFESVLDGVRSHTILVDRTDIAIFFQASDILADLVRAARDDEPADQEKVQSILDKLSVILGDNAQEEDEVDASDFQPMGIALDLGLPELSDNESVDTDTQHEPAITTDAISAPGNEKPEHFLEGFKIFFQPDSSLYETGNEPLHLLKLLREIGEVDVSCDTSNLKSLSELEEEKSYLAWTIYLATDEDEASVRDIFDFVADLCKLDISPISNSTLPPSNKTDDAPLSSELSIVPTASETVVPPAPPQISQNTADLPVRKSTVPTLPKTNTDNNKPSNKPRPTVRVDLERIDRLVNLVGELVINQAMISQSVTDADLPSNSAISAGLDEFMQLTRDIQDSVMMIRAQPVKSLFQRMSRIIRESSAMVGKSVCLKTDGENTEVDKTVIERLADPLTHMIRNAVDHGIEKEEDRLNADKPAEGIVTLMASHRSGRVIIEVSDDGAGINRERVLQIAMDKGLVAENSQLSDTEIDNLLFLPGFSTASEVSDLSGRGVGMDVVKSSIIALGGRVTIQSEPGQGTKFTISLPLTLAVLDGMVIEVAKQILVVPLNAIAETLTLTQESVLPLGPNNRVIKVRDVFVPLLDLGSELGFRAPLNNFDNAVVLLISQENGTQAALVVDAIQDQRQVVIKGLQNTFGRPSGVAAATILGDGKIALILDPIDIVSSAESAGNLAQNNLQLTG